MPSIELSNLSTSKNSQRQGTQTPATTSSQERRKSTESVCAITLQTRSECEGNGDLYVSKDELPHFYSKAALTEWYKDSNIGPQTRVEARQDILTLFPDAAKQNKWRRFVNAPSAITLVAALTFVPTLSMTIIGGLFIGSGLDPNWCSNIIPMPGGGVRVACEGSFAVYTDAQFQALSQQHSMVMQHSKLSVIGLFVAAGGTAAAGIACLLAMTQARRQFAADPMQRSVELPPEV